MKENSTKFAKFIDGLSFKRAKGLFILFACIIGALAIILVPALTSNSNASNDGGFGAGTGGGSGSGDTGSSGNDGNCNQFANNVGNNTGQNHNRPSEQRLPTGDEEAVAFQVLHLSSRYIAVGNTMTRMLNIVTDARYAEDVITNWTVSCEETAKVTFFPFTIHALAPGNVTITLTANRVGGGSQMVRMINLVIV